MVGRQRPTFFRLREEPTGKKYTADLSCIGYLRENSGNVALGTAPLACRSDRQQIQNISSCYSFSLRLWGWRREEISSVPCRTGNAKGRGTRWPTIPCLHRARRDRAASRFSWIGKKKQKKCGGGLAAPDGISPASDIQPDRFLKSLGFKTIERVTWRPNGRFGIALGPLAGPKQLRRAPGLGSGGLPSFNFPRRKGLEWKKEEQKRCRELRRVGNETPQMGGSSCPARWRKESASKNPAGVFAHSSVWRRGRTE